MNCTTSATCRQPILWLIRRPIWPTIVSNLPCCRYNNNTLYSFFHPVEVAKVFPFLKQYRLRDYIITDDQALYNQLDPDWEVKVVAVKPELVDSDAKQVPAVAEKPVGKAYADGKPVVLEFSVEDRGGVATVKHPLHKDVIDTDTED
jgi:hypothetical protein